MKPLSLLILIVTLFSMNFCTKDFIVEDISKKTITINAPANNTTTTSNPVTFWWEPLEGAEKYTLQIVEPNFTSISALLLDTIISNTKFNVALQPGTYQWRIQASNAGHKTVFQIFNIKIDTTSDLSNTFVKLISPKDGAITGNKTVSLVWSSINQAKKYRIIINDGLVLDSVITKTSFTYTLPATLNSNTGFSWNVKAINDRSESQYNAKAFSFTVDLKPPSAPTLLSPINGFTVKDTTKLVWNRNNASEINYDSIYVATDSAFTNLISQTVVNATSVKINVLSNPPIANSTFYWWKLRSFDPAGNRSVFSTQLKFKLIP